MSSHTGGTGTSQEAQGKGPAEPKSVGQKKANKKNRDKHQPSRTSDENNNHNKARNKNLVEELKLFQNSNLIHQQDPLEQLQQQLSQMIQEDENATRIEAQKRLFKPNNKKSAKNGKNQPNLHEAQQQPNGNHQSQETSLSAQDRNFAYQQTCATLYDNVARNGFVLATSSTAVANDMTSGDSSMITIKKGVVHYQAQSKRLFQRWKKRYVILTPTSIFLFKKSDSKVGHSEMGRFISKVSLSDITRTENLKGVILLFVKDQINFYLRSKEHSEWFSLIEESIERSKKRRQQYSSNGAPPPLMDQQQILNGNSIGQIHSSSTEGFYENAALPRASDGIVINSQINETDPVRHHKDGHRGSSYGTDPNDPSEPREWHVNPLNDLDEEPASDRRSIEMMAQSEGTAPTSSEINSCSIEQKANTQGGNQRLGGAQTIGEDGPSLEANVAVQESERSEASCEPMINDDTPAKDGNQHQDKPGEGAEQAADGKHFSSRKRSLEATPSSNPLSQANKRSPDQSTPSSSSSASEKTTMSKRQPHGDDDVAPTPHEPTDKSGTSGTSGSESSVIRSKASSKSGQASQDDETTKCGRQNGRSHERSPEAQDSTTLSSESEANRDSANKRHAMGPMRKQQRVVGRRDSKQERPMASNNTNGANLIRRDDSWQSLVSLTQVGRQGKSLDRTVGQINELPSESPFLTTGVNSGGTFGISRGFRDREMASGRSQLNSGHVNSNLLTQTIASFDSLGDQYKITITIGPANAHKHNLRAPNKDADEPLLANGFSGGATGQQQQQRHLTNFDSTVTPMRHRPMRQQSLQAVHSRRLPAPLLNGRPQLQQHSFDGCAQIPSSPSFQYNQRLPPQQLATPYHQRLMQLQLLHNSNNIDYIRANGFQPPGPPMNANSNGGGVQNDYQIYGPESIATTANHYGYYSMRSNLKSATSEFSFIRPSDSSNIIQQQQRSTQMPVPYGPHNRHPNDRASLVLSGPTNHAQVAGPNQAHGRTRMTASPSANGQYLLQGPVSWQQAPPLPPPSVPPPQVPAQMNGYDNNQQQQSAGLNHLTLAELAAPNRDLPLKPNRRRQRGTDMAEAQNNSLGSSIVHFFKRAFSKRSKRQAKLGESCSSSMMDSGNFEAIQVAQSAYSTGSKSFQADRGFLCQQPAPQQQQQQRMIDLIEAFANKTALEDPYNVSQASGAMDSQPRQQLSSTLQRAHFGGTRLRASGASHYQQQQQQQQSHHVPQPLPQMIVSPLQRTNSMSGSMMMSATRPNGAVRRSHHQHHQAASFDQAHDGSAYSPLVTRSTKVMSANLTPVFGRKDPLELQQKQQFAVPSPRHSANLDQIPRPSSIYGQPSMISSPVFTNGLSGREAFGNHRNSAHGSYHNPRNQHPLSANDFRRGGASNQLSKAPYLDTTREVAEEISSPTTESRAFMGHLNNNDVMC